MPTRAAGRGGQAVAYDGRHLFRQDGRAPAVEVDRVEEDAMVVARVPGVDDLDIGAIGQQLAGERLVARVHPALLAVGLILGNERRHHPEDPDVVLARQPEEPAGVGRVQRQGGPIVDEDAIPLRHVTLVLRGPGC